MKKLYLILSIVLMLGWESCNDSGQSVPETNTVLSQAFPIRIYQPSGVSDEQIIDISSSELYNSFKKNVSGYTVTKITYHIKNDNVPADMYFSGQLQCENEEGTETCIAGTISRVKISDIVSSTSDIKEIKVIENREEIEKVIGWIDSPGKFKLSSIYTLTDDANSPYTIGPLVSGSNFELIIRFHITVKLID